MRRPESRRGVFSLTILLLLINLAVFIVLTMNKADNPAGFNRFLDYVALSPDGMLHGFVWQLVTFQFLHLSGGHFLFNMIALYVFGQAVEEALGKKQFLTLYLVSGIIGGVVQTLLGLALSSRFGGSVVGASAGVLGLVGAFATIDPNRELLLFFVLPVRARYVFWLTLIGTLLYIAVPSSTGIAHGAHLGGILAGAGYIRYGFQLRSWSFLANPFRARQRRRDLVKAATVKPGRWNRPKRANNEELPAEEFISREVDPILDKISAHGIQSLTPRERQILEAARSKMAKR